MTGTVYCIKEIATNEVIYAGSTTQTLNHRKSAHKYNCYSSNERLNSSQVYVYIRSKATKEEFYNKFVFVALLKKNFDNTDDLRIQEEYYINELNPLCNSVKAYSSDEDKRIKINAWRNKPENKAKLNEYEKAYNALNKDKRKKYREDNKEKIQLKNHLYYEKHKEKIKERSKQRYAMKNNISINGCN